MAKRNYDVTVQKVGDCNVVVGGLNYNVTLCMTGVCTVAAEDTNDAMEIINNMPNSELNGMIIWCDDGACVTDACCTNDAFDEIDAMEAVADVDFDSVEINWDDYISALDADEEIDV